MQIAPINYIEIRDGKPLIAGTGLKVAIIAPMYVRYNVPIDWIAENYDLTPAQIHAAISYYYDHAEELDRFVQEGEELVKRIGIPSSEVIERMRERQRKNMENKD
jgi:uncharacterized protein (DUF433 family)